MNPRTIRFAVYALVGLCLIGASYGIRRAADQRFVRETQAAADSARATQVILANRDQQVEAIITKGSTWSDLLGDMHFDPQTVFNVTEAVHKVFNLRGIRPGNKLVATKTSAGELKSVSYRIDSEHQLLVNREGDAFQAQVKETLGTVTVVPITGVVDGSLFDSIIAAGEKPELAVRLAEIFAWDLDFNSDTQDGDIFRFVVEKKDFADGSPSTYGRILAAEYDNVGHPYRAVLFRDPQGRPAYYSADGKSLQKAFLRSPLRFAARISSHFSTHRFHPILRTTRAHLGTDYAAPVGTPVQTIADGRVVFASYKGGDGNMVKITHIRGYETYYLHLSRILVRRGQSVRQGQTIGLVGATGLATGPHLDFRIEQAGRFVNFERLKLPPTNPVAKSEWADFVAERDKWMAMLPGTEAQNAAKMARR